MKQADILIEAIQRQFPDAVFITPKMIDAVTGISESEIRHHCRRLFRHDGHYRFWLDGEPCKRFLSRDDLERLLRYMRQVMGDG